MPRRLLRVGGLTSTLAHQALHIPVAFAEHAQHSLSVGGNPEHDAVISPTQTRLNEAQRLRELLLGVIEQREMIARDHTLPMGTKWNKGTGLAACMHPLKYKCHANAGNPQGGRPEIGTACVDVTATRLGRWSNGPRCPAQNWH